MRIITGKLKGRIIPVPETGILRPTTDRTKEGIFSALASRIYFSGLSVLDLFAGSGNLGFEALSRGAANVVFVDSESEHIHHIQKLADQFKLSPHIKTVRLPVDEYLSSVKESFDIIFADPPYEYYLLDRLPNHIFDRGILAKEGYFVLEHDKRHDFSPDERCFYSRAYGRTIVSIFENLNVDSNQKADE